MRGDHDWIQTYTGRRFWPLDPDPDSICLEDIAHALSLQCRFSGHTSRHYSIAEHSLVVADLVPKHLRLQALLHDASEAYLVDLPRPLKQLPAFAGYRKSEARLQRLIYEQFGCDPVIAPEVRDADLAALGLEVFWLMQAETDWDYPEILAFAEKRFGRLHKSCIGQQLATTKAELIENQFTISVLEAYRNVA